MNKAKGIKKDLNIEFEKTNSKIASVKRPAVSKDVSIVFNVDSTKSKITLPPTEGTATEISNIKSFDLDEAFLDILDEDKTKKTIVFNKTDLLKEIDGIKNSSGQDLKEVEDDGPMSFTPMPIVREDHTKSEINLQALVAHEEVQEAQFESSDEFSLDNSDGSLILESSSEAAENVVHHEANHQNELELPDANFSGEDENADEDADEDAHEHLSRVQDLPDTVLAFEENSNSSIDLNIDLIALGEVKEEVQKDEFMEFKPLSNPHLNAELESYIAEESAETGMPESESLANVEFEIDDFAPLVDVTSDRVSEQKDFNQDFLKHEKEAFLSSELKGKNLSNSMQVSPAEELSVLRELRQERDGFLEEIFNLKKSLKMYEQDILGMRSNLEEARIEVGILRKRHQSDIEDYKYQFNVLEDKKNRAVEAAKLSEEKMIRLEQKVRIDFNQIKHREKELESKLELLTMDVDAQINSRDQKILELRRKIDSLEFNMENASIREHKTIDDKRKLEDRLNKIMKTLKHSMKTLEEEIDEVASTNTEKGKN